MTVRASTLLYRFVQLRPLFAGDPVSLGGACIGSSHRTPKQPEHEPGARRRPPEDVGLERRLQASRCQAVRSNLEAKVFQLGARQE